MKFIVHTDGGARGNPGPAAVGVVIEKVQSANPPAGRAGCKVQSKTELIKEFGKRIGMTTNNVAEYSAVLEGLRNVKYQMSNIKYQDRKQMQIQFILDSTLVVNQLNGLFKVKDTKLRKLLAKIRILEQEAGGVVTYAVVPREKNRRADFLVNQALDRGYPTLMSSSIFSH